MFEISLLWMPVIAAGAVALLGVAVYFIATRDRGHDTRRRGSDGRNGKTRAEHPTAP